MIVRSFRVSTVTTALSAFAMIGAVACSSSSSGSSGDASSSSGFIDEYCSYIASCCGTQSLPSDGKECHALFSLASGTYDPVAGSQCIADVKAASSSSAAWCADTSTNPPSCNGVYKKAGQAANVAPGGACSADSDCAAAPTGDTVSCRHYFGENGGSDVDICQVVVPGKAGDACNGQASTSGGVTSTSYYGDDDSTNPKSQITVCVDSDGVECSSTDGTTYACKALAKTGEECFGDSECVTDDYCDSANSKCAARADDGSACSSGGIECVAADYCDAGSSTCIAKAKAGAACGTAAECASNDCENGKCGAGIASIGLAFYCGSSSSN